MIRWHRTGIPAQGKAVEVQQWVGQVAALVPKIAPEAKMLTMVTKYGDMAINWFVDGPDIGTVDALTQKVFSDERYKELLAKAQTGGLFMAGSLRTVVYEVPIR